MTKTGKRGEIAIEQRLVVAAGRYLACVKFDHS